MNTEKNADKKSSSQRVPKSDKPGTASGTGTEAERKGGVEPAKHQAEQDWEDSAKEDGD